MKKLLFLVICSSLLLPAASAAGQAPAIFFSDIDGGPKAGGQNNQGAIVTIYGKNFGATQGTSVVTIGGGAAAAYLLWSDTKVAFSLGAAAATGNIIITVNGAASNGVPFSIRTGNIFFVATTGNNTANGSFATPWKTIVKAKNTLGPGDIAYIMDGISQTALDDFNAALEISSAGISGSPKALVAYPGAAVTIGSATGPEFGLRTPQIAGGPFSFWTIAGFTIRGNNEGIDLETVDGWRIVGNDMSCPNGGGPTACFEGSETTHLKFLGNTVHDSGTGNTKLYHSVYLTTDSNHIEIGWNTLANNKTCRGIQFHSTSLGAGSGFNQFDLSVHDNVIHGQICDGINFATIDPSKGPVLAYNNIVYDVGRGPDPPDGSSNYSCLLSAGITNAGTPGTGTAQVFNNTFYDCGVCANTSGSCDLSGNGAISVQSGSPALKFTNNIMVTRGTEVYVAPNTSAALISGSNNLFGTETLAGVFGAGSAPAQFSASISGDPKFSGVSVANFHLLAGSPAIDAGITPVVLIPRDFDGNPRPEGTAFDVGAFEAVSALAAPNPPTNLKATVH